MGGREAQDKAECYGSFPADAFDLTVLLYKVSSTELERIAGGIR